MMSKENKEKLGTSSGLSYCAFYKEGRVRATKTCQARFGMLWTMRQWTENGGTERVENARLEADVFLTTLYAERELWSVLTITALRHGHTNIGRPAST